MNFPLSVLNAVFSSLEFGRGLFDCQLDSEQLGVVAVTALSALGQPPPLLFSPQPQVDFYFPSGESRDGGEWGSK